MPQELYVLRCYSCQTFQVQIVKKVPKWKCNLCNEKQSVTKVYAQGNGKDCRSYVQELNFSRGRIQDSSDNTKPALCSTSVNTNFHHAGNISKWTEFTTHQDNNDSSDEDSQQLITNSVRSVSTARRAKLNDKMLYDPSYRHSQHHIPTKQLKSKKMSSKSGNIKVANEIESGSDIDCFGNGEQFIFSYESNSKKPTNLIYKDNSIKLGCNKGEDATASTINVIPDKNNLSVSSSKWGIFLEKENGEIDGGAVTKYETLKRNEVLCSADKETSYEGKSAVSMNKKIKFESSVDSSHHHSEFSQNNFQNVTSNISAVKVSHSVFNIDPNVDLDALFDL